jgi:CHAT domain-containing protein
MKHLKLKYILILLLPLFCRAQDFNPKLKEVEAIYEKGNAELALQQVLSKIKLLESDVKRNLLVLSEHYNLAGEIYYYQSDIEEAYNYWDKSYKLIKYHYGEHSIYIAENYSLLARYFNFRINKDTAFIYASKAIEICRQKKDSLCFIPVNKIYREYAYALKIKRENFDYLLARDESRIYLDSALYFNNKYFAGNAIYSAQIFHDLGNLYTDKTLYLKRNLHNTKKSIECLSKANSYYNRALAIRIKAWGNKHDKIATLYFVKGLSYFYCYDNDSLLTTLKFYQKGFCALSQQYNGDSVLSIPNPKLHSINPVLALTILRFKIDALHNFYNKTKDINYLESCYNHSKVAVELWETTFQNLKTHEINQALEVYSAAPFASIIPFANEYYQQTKNSEAKSNVFRWMSLNKYSVLLKNQIDNHNFSFNSENSSVLEIQNKLHTDEAIVEYYYRESGFSCAVITKNNFDLFPENKTFKINKQIDSLLIHLKNHQANKYCKTAKQLYDSILNPYIKNLPKEITHLIISPHNKLAQIPFDALVLNETNNYSKADFLIKHYDISYALSCNLLYEDKENALLNKNIASICPEYKQQTNLSFSKQAIQNLEAHFNLSKFNIGNINQNNSILHVTAHAYCDYKNSSNSFILLTDTNKLALNQLSSKKLNYKLVVLSACETANGDIEAGEGVINFNRHLYLAGAKSTISTLWKVDDEATSSIIGNFYSSILIGESAITSLYHAKLNYLKTPKSIDDYDPYYWAGLIYTGKDLHLEESKSNNYILYAIGGIASITCVLLFRKFRF